MTTTGCERKPSECNSRTTRVLTSSGCTGWVLTTCPLILTREPIRRDDNSRILQRTTRRHNTRDSSLFLPLSTHLTHPRKHANHARVLLVSGGQVLDGHVELLIHGDIPVIPSKVAHRTAKEGIHSGEGRQETGGGDGERVSRTEQIH